MTIKHPGYGIYTFGEDCCSDRTCQPRGGSVNIKTGFICKECGQSVLSYKRPEKCEEHMDNKKWVDTLTKGDGTVVTIKTAAEEREDISKSLDIKSIIKDEIKGKKIRHRAVKYSRKTPVSLTAPQKRGRKPSGTMVYPNGDRERIMEVRGMTSSKEDKVREIQLIIRKSPRPITYIGILTDPKCPVKSSNSVKAYIDELLAHKLIYQMGRKPAAFCPTSKGLTHMYDAHGSYPGEMGVAEVKVSEDAPVEVATQEVQETPTAEAAVVNNTADMAKSLLAALLDGAEIQISIKLKR